MRLLLENAKILCEILFYIFKKITGLWTGYTGLEKANVTAIYEKDDRDLPLNY